MLSLLRTFLNRRPVALYNPPNRRRTRSLFLEELENRKLLAIYNWVLPGDGNFGNASNWLNSRTNLPGVPSASDTASIPSSVKVTSSTGRTVDNVQCLGSLEISGGTFNVQNTIGDSLIQNLVVKSGTAFRTSGGSTAIIGSQNSGTIDTLSSGTFRYQRGTNVLMTGGTLTGLGQYTMLGDVFGGPLLDLQTNLTAPKKFLFANGSIAGTGTLSIPGIFNWDADSTASMTGMGQTVVLAGGMLTINGGAVGIDQRTINNFGTIVFGASEDLAMTRSATINNQVAGILDAKSNVAITGDATSEIINAGTIRKSSGTGTSLLQVRLENTATLDVQTGTLSLFSGFGTAGTYRTATNAFLDLTGGNAFHIGGTSNFQGSGTVLSGTGILTTASLGGTWSIPPTITFVLTSGVIVVPGGSTQTIDGTVTYEGSSDTTIRGGGRIVLNGDFLHAGTGNLILGGDLRTNTFPTTFSIPVRSTYTFYTNAGIAVDGVGGVINNVGSIVKAGGLGTTLIAPLINNRGTIRSNVGTLATRNVSSSGGIYSAVAGAFVKLNEGVNSTFLETGIFYGNGSGTILIAAGDVLIGSTGATFNIAPATKFLLNGRSLHVPLSKEATFNGNLTLSGSNDLVLAGGGTLVLNGTFNHLTARNIRFTGSTTLLVGSTGIYDLRRDVSFLGIGRIINQGNFRKTAGVGTSTIGVGMKNSNSVESRSGTLKMTGLISELRSNFLTGGRWTASSNAVTPASLDFSRPIGTLSHDAIVVLSGPLASIPNLSGLGLNAGSLELLAGAQLTIIGGLTNGSQLVVGPGSQLKVIGELQMNSFSSIIMQMSGNDMGKITATTYVGMSGTFNVAYMGAVPMAPIGTVFEIIESGRNGPYSGSFRGRVNTSLITIGNAQWRIRYNDGTGDDVTLTRVS